MRKIVTVGILSSLTALVVMSGCSSSDEGSKFDPNAREEGGTSSTPTGTFFPTDSGLPSDEPSNDGGVTGDVTTVPVVCGDGILGGAEACDDGNTTADDGCSST